MKRLIGHALAGLALLGAGLALAGCNDSRSPSPERKSSTTFAPGRQPADAKLAYRHQLTVGLSPGKVAAHFEAARDRCLNEASLRCVLLESSVNEATGTGARPFAQLEVRLPHESVPAFVAFVTSPLPGEAPGEVILRDQATRSEDLTQSIADSGRRLAQLTDYRDRLNALSGRSDTRVEDLIKIANELSQVQIQIEELEGKKRGLEERVATEIVEVVFRADSARMSALVPVQDAWEQSGRTLGESAGGALGFAIASLPWLPLVAIVILLVRWLWRLRRRRHRALIEPDR